MPLGTEGIYLIILLMSVGIVAGYVGGLFGVGGGTILVPIFLTIFPLVHTSSVVVMHNAVGTSLALLIPNTAMAVSKQYKVGNVDFALLRKWIPFVVGGAIIGTSIIRFIPTLYLKIFFTVYLYMSFLFLAMRKHKESEAHHKPRGPWLRVAGAGIGAVAVLLGMGGGPFSVPFSQLYNYPMRKAISFSSATGFFIGIVGVVGMVVSGWGIPGRSPYSLGFVNIIAVLIITPFVLIFSPYGVKTANQIAKKKLKRIYVLFLASIALYMTFQVFHPI